MYHLAKSLYLYATSKEGKDHTRRLIACMSLTDRLRILRPATGIRQRWENYAPIANQGPVSAPSRWRHCSQPRQNCAYRWPECRHDSIIGHVPEDLGCGWSNFDAKSVAELLLELPRHHLRR